MYCLDDYNYDLDEELIASYPKEKREFSNLLILNKKKNNFIDDKFYNLINYLKEGDVLVFNDTKVFPARLIGKKKDSLGKVEIFLLNFVSFQKNTKEREVLIKGKNIKKDLIIIFPYNNLSCKVLEKSDEGIFKIIFNQEGGTLKNSLEKNGKIPLPAYIEKKRDQENINFSEDKCRYQTVYANDDKSGSVAASTAGFHFSKKLLKNLEEKNIQLEYVTLYVGLGTFSPVRSDNIRDHKMHKEFYEIDDKVFNRIKKAKEEKRKIIAVGTTSARTLESVLYKGKQKLSGWTDIFIYPGFEFKIIDGLITNFHLPKSSLLIMVSALCGRKKILRAYNEAISRKYRFFSYGDAMLII